MQIDVNYDQNPNTLPAGFVSDVDYVVQTFDALFTNNVTFTVDIGYGEIDGQALAPQALGESEATNYYAESYSSVKNALVAENAPGAPTLPSSSPLSGTLYLSQGEATALGLYPNNGSLEGYVGFNSTANIFSYGINTTPPAGEYYFVGVLEHELTEDMGRVSLLDGQPSYYGMMDLYRYSSPGVRDLQVGANGSGSTAYFSIDDGNTNLGSWNNDPTNGDLGDWYPSGPASGGYDAFNDYSYPGVVNALSNNDITLMEGLGWTTTASRFPGAALGTISAGLLTQGDVENNGTTDLVWRAANTQTTVWAVSTSGTVTTASLGSIGTSWVILNSADYLSSTTTQMLTQSTADGTMTLWWVNNGTLAGIDLGQYWQGIAYVASGNFTNMGSDDILVRNQSDNHMYVWWVNSSTHTLQGYDLGAYWANIGFIAAGAFYQSGETNMLVKNLTDNHMYDWWVDPTTHTLQGVDLGAYLTVNQVVATGNFLANGSDDMLVRNTSDNHMYVWWIGGSGTLQGIDLGAYWGNVSLLASGHFAGSGDEMLVQNQADDSVYMWWVNTSNNTLSGTNLGPISPQWQIVATGDYNGDGYTDIVWRNTATGQVNLWDMGGYSLPANSTFIGSSAGATGLSLTSNTVSSGGNIAPSAPQGNFASSQWLSAMNDSAANYAPYFKGLNGSNAGSAAGLGGVADSTGPDSHLFAFSGHNTTRL